MVGAIVLSPSDAASQKAVAGSAQRVVVGPTTKQRATEQRAMESRSNSPNNVVGRH